MCLAQGPQCSDAYQCCLLITLPSRQRVSSGRDSDVYGGINLMILTQAILKTMFVCCHTTDSLKMPPTKKYGCFATFQRNIFIIILDIFLIFNVF